MQSGSNRNSYERHSHHVVSLGTQSTLTEYGATGGEGLRFGCSWSSSLWHLVSLKHDMEFRFRDQKHPKNLSAWPNHGGPRLSRSGAARLRSHAPRVYSSTDSRSSLSLST